jgi:preprotein translocase subunit SecY
LIPSVVVNLFGFPTQVAYLMGGTSLIIMVGVDLD